MALNIGDVIFNEFVSDNTTVSTLSTSNDFFELLVLTDGADLRGLRVTDNEITPTSNNALNNGESVYIFGQDSFLASVAKGTVVAVYTNPANLSIINSDTFASAAAHDWRLVLQDGAGITISTDGLGGAVNPGLSTTGEGLYLYLPSTDGSGNSAGTDNVYLDYISFGTDSAEAPSGLFDLNLPDSGGTIAPPPATGTPSTTPQTDEGYYVGSTASGNDLAPHWVTYDVGAAGAPNPLSTPGEANPGQDLSRLRGLDTNARSGDFNGDGNKDILWRDGNTGDVYGYLLNSFTVATENFVRQGIPFDYKIINTGDFNSDGNDDILWRDNTNGEGYVYFMNGLSVVNEGAVTGMAGERIVGRGNFDGGADDELVTINSAQTISICQILPQAGGGFQLTALASPPSFNIGTRNVAGVGDFNGDNQDDVLLRDVNGDVSMLINNGSSWTESLVRNVTKDWVIEGVDNLNFSSTLGNPTDNNADIIWRNSLSGAVYGYEMNGATVAAERGIGLVSPYTGWNIAGTGDINGDGNGDIIWRNGSTDPAFPAINFISAWQMDGFDVPTPGDIRQVGSNWSVSAPTI
jgi:hypothetical protein